MARDFDSVDDKVTTALTAHATTRTWFLHYYQDGNGEGGFGKLFTKSAGATLIENLTATTFGELRFERGWSGGYAAWAIAVPSLSAWHTIGISYNSSSTTQDPVIYVDGSVVTITGEFSPTGTLLTNSDAYVIGNYGDTSTTWDGRIAEWAVWDAILTAAEHAALGRGIDPRLIRPQSLVSYIPLYGAQSPEPDWKNATGATVSGAVAIAHPRLARATSSRESVNERAWWTTPTNAGNPVPKIEIAPTDTLLATSPTWVDITSFVREIDVTLSGRQKDLDEMESASGTMTLNNDDRRFDPTNSAGPYWPLRAEMQMRITVTYNGGTWTVFRGFVRGFDVAWDSDWEPRSGEGHAETMVEISDLISIIAEWPIGSTFSSVEAAGTRLKKILDVLYANAGGGGTFPTEMTSGLSGGLNCRTIVYNAQEDYIWDALKETYGTGAADTPIRVDNAGRVLWGGGSATPYMFGDLPNTVEIPYTTGKLKYNTDLAVTTVQVADGTIVVTASSGANGGSSPTGVRSARTYSRDVISSGTVDMQTLANSIYDLRKDPAARPEAITIKPAGRGDVAWTPVLSIRQEDRVVLRRRPPGGGLFQQSQRVTKIRHVIKPHAAYWETTYSLAGAAV